MSDMRVLPSGLALGLAAPHTLTYVFNVIGYNVFASNGKTCKRLHSSPEAYTIIMRVGKGVIRERPSCIGGAACGRANALWGTGLRTMGFFQRL